MELSIGVEKQEKRRATEVMRQSSKKMKRMAMNIPHSIVKVWKKTKARKIKLIRRSIIKRVKTSPKNFPRRN